MREPRFAADWARGLLIALWRLAREHDLDDPRRALALHDAHREMARGDQSLLEALAEASGDTLAVQPAEHWTGGWLVLAGERVLWEAVDGEMRWIAESDVDPADPPPVVQRLARGRKL